MAAILSWGRGVNGNAPCGVWRRCHEYGQWSVSVCNACYCPCQSSPPQSEANHVVRLLTHLPLGKWPAFHRGYFQMRFRDITFVIVPIIIIITLKSQCKQDVTPLPMHWRSVFRALTPRSYHHNFESTHEYLMCYCIRSLARTALGTW